MKNGIPDPLQSLDDIKRVEAPPFLMTRIQEKIKQGSGQVISAPQIALLSMGLMLLIALNVWVVYATGMGQDVAPQLVESLNLYPDNELYPSL